MGKTIALSNHKGGVGKTTITHTLGSYFAEGGYRTLLVDMDSQGSLTLSCGVKDAAGQSLAEVLGAVEPGTAPLAHVIRHIAPNLDLAPADIALSSTQLGLVTRIGREFTLRDAMAPVMDEYDLVLIDSPPGQGLLTVNALSAANGVIPPTKPAASDLAGLKLFIQSTMLPLRQRINPNLVLIGIVITFYDDRKLLHRGILRDMTANKWPILACIGQSVRVEEAAGVHETILSYEPDNPRAEEFRKLGYKVSKWLENAPNKQ